MKLNMILASIFGGKKATTEATENMNTTNVVSINPSEALATMTEAEKAKAVEMVIKDIESHRLLVTFTEKEATEATELVEALATMTEADTLATIRTHMEATLLGRENKFSTCVHFAALYKNMVLNLSIQPTPAETKKAVETLAEMWEAKAVQNCGKWWKVQKMMEAHTTEEPEIITTPGMTTHHTPEEVEAMTVEKALETLAGQLAEKKADIWNRGTTAKKLAKELEKAEKKEKEAEALATVAEASTTATEKEKKCKRFAADFWHTTTEELKEAHTEALKKEAEALAKVEALKAKATETLEAIQSGTITLAEAVAGMTTEELETMETVAGEIKKAKKEKALEATNKATEAVAMEKVATVAVATRHMNEGTATAGEVATVALAEVEAEKSTIMETAKKKLEAITKKVAEKVKAQVKKEYTFSKALAKMKEEAEAWQEIYTEAGVNITVDTMTPATLSEWCHVFMKVPTGRGLQIGTGRGTKAVDKWTLEALNQYILTNDTLCTMTEAGEINTATMEAHTATLEKAEKALATVVELEALAAKAKADKKAKEEKKAEAEKVTSTATVEELAEAITEAETAKANTREVEKALAEAKKEATEAVADVKAEKVETLETVKEAEKKAEKKSTGRGRGTGRGAKKSGTTGGRGKKATGTTAKAVAMEEVEKSGTITTETVEAVAS